MDTVVIALGSNIGNRHQHLKDAHQFLSQLSVKPTLSSPIYITEPVGPSIRYFLNAVIEIVTDLTPEKLLIKLKSFEQNHGRAADHPRWSARTIDLDIISFGHLLIQNDSLIIPHPEYGNRLFVLDPLRDIHPNWHDPKTKASISDMIKKAPALQLKKTTLSW